MTWRDIRNFAPVEFDSPDAPGSGADMMDLQFVALLDGLRDRCGFPLVITSGYRTEAYNARLEDSVQGSAHCAGKAADIMCRDSHTRYLILRHALAMDFMRVGLGRTFIHLDVDEDKPQDVAWMY